MCPEETEQDLPLGADSAAAARAVTDPVAGRSVIASARVAERELPTKEARPAIA